MAASAQNLPHHEGRRQRIGFSATEDEGELIRRAAELRGVTMTQYVLCAVLDRAERDLYEHAVRAQPAAAAADGAAEPLHAIAHLFTA
ncbi:MAG TPA: DUF1778 domain-containing protein [Streptosporangiaceae bacterium]